MKRKKIPMAQETKTSLGLLFVDVAAAGGVSAVTAAVFAVVAVAGADTT
jgi:hypothetical protein